ncbi:WD40/YVTN/BNR-like repeat-containing protein [Chitinimonas naiadis]
MVLNILKSWWRLALLASLLALGACGSESKPGEAPKNFAVQAGEGQVTITWDDDPAITYWVFGAAAPSVTTENYAKFPEARVLWPARSPLVISGLTNGKTYSFIMNSTQNGSGAGPATASLSAVPRPAGGVWTLGSNAGTATLNGLAYSGYYMAVGNGGSIQRSTNGKDWTALTSGTTADLTTIFFDNVRFMVLGTDGKLLTSTDANTWTASTVPTNATQRINHLNSAAGAGVYLAVGDGGTILTSPPDISAWTAQTSGTTKNLYRGLFTAGGFITVGAGGTILTSLDAKTWTAQTSNTTADLRGIYYNGSTFVAVGNNGTVLSSTSGITGVRVKPGDATDTSVYGPMTWTANASGTTQNLTAVSAVGQFVIVGDNGTLLTGKGDGTWTLGSTGMTGNPKDMITGGGVYVAVGTGGSTARSY